MNKKLKFIIIAAVCIAVFAGVYILYGALSERYAPNQFATPVKPSSDDSVAPAENTPDTSPEQAVQDTSDKDSQSQGGSSETPDYTAPDFIVYDENGNEVRLHDYFGKPIVLNFWASWCGFCLQEMPAFNEAYHNNPDVQFLMVNITDGKMETMSSAKKILDSNGYDFPVFYDTTLQASNTYVPSGIPFTAFIDENGQYVTYANGRLTAELLDMGISMIK